MNRRTPTLILLAMVGVLLGASLSLAQSARPALLTPTVAPLFDKLAYMPLIHKDGPVAPTATSTATAEPTASSTNTATTTDTATATSTATASPTATDTATATSTATTQPTATNTATAMATSTATTLPTATNTATSTATATATNTATSTATTEPTATNTATNTATATSTATTEPTATQTATATATNTATTEPTATNTATSTATQTATATATNTATTEPTATNTATSTATTPPTATASATSTATATATPKPVETSCVDNVFPIAVNQAALQNNQPYWYRPVPMVDPFAENSSIPTLNTTNSASPRFRVYRQSMQPGQLFYWGRWNGAEASGSSLDLTRALSGTGSLPAGFSEFPPPANYPEAIPLVNGKLESGDWLAGTGATLNASAVSPLLDSHIAKKDLLILPVYDLVYGNGGTADSAYRVTRLMMVRLLDYRLAPTSGSYLEFALVQDNPLCYLELRTVDNLEWYGPTTVPLEYASYDMVIVQDYTYSMRNCWDTNAACATGSRRIDYAAASLRAFVNDMLVVRNGQNGADHRLAYVTFGQKATTVVGFNNDQAATLAAFKNAIGDLSAPRTIPNTQLTGNTNTANGLAAAVASLNGARKVDKNGRPVKLMVVLLTDGIANVFNDGPAWGSTNGWNAAPYYCGKSNADLDNPLVQYNCPSQANYPDHTVSRPPLAAMVKVATDAREQKAIDFFAVTLGEQFGLTPQSMHLEDVAPGNAYMANRPDQLSPLLATLYQIELPVSCQEFRDGQPAAGAYVVVRNIDGEVMAEGVADADGVFRANLPLIRGQNPDDYTYIASVAHNGVVAPADPYQIPRNYAAAREVFFVSGVSSPNYVPLFNTNPANAKCP